MPKTFLIRKKLSLNTLDTDEPWISRNAQSKMGALGVEDTDKQGNGHKLNKLLFTSTFNHRTFKDSELDSAATQNYVGLSFC